MSAKLIIEICYVIICIAMVIIVLMQESKTSGLGTSLSGMSDTYWSKNKAHSTEGKLKMATRVLAVLLIVLTVVINSKFL
ncbi:preprotein translocase subunit SecG [Lachnospiraceae bacterium RM5]|nr:preprotein translocase subunit SecG [Lachnospiraceae bacterium RM5]